MPTPSSDPPPDPSSPPSYNFSTCPEELQYPSHNSQQLPRGEMTPGLESASEGGSPSPPDAPSVDSDLQQSRTLAREESVVTDDRISAEPSSRATTVSPRPRSSATGATSPPPDVSGVDKPLELESRHGIGSTSATDCVSPLDHLSSQEDLDDEYDSLEDMHNSCFIGLDYSNKRVCVRQFLERGCHKLTSH